MQIYLTNKEISALLSLYSSWESTMVDGEQTVNTIEERLNDGLGSALYKLSKGRACQGFYEEYKNKCKKE